MKLDFNASPITFSQIVLVLTVLVILVSSGLAWHYHGAYRNVSDKLLILQHDVAEQNKEALEKLKTLTIERDQQQAKLDKQYKEQGYEDEIAKNGIERLNAQLRDATVRVRVESKGGCGGSGSISDQASYAANRAADDSTAYGVLPESNTQRLADALSEVETLSAAYNSCRAVSFD